MRLEVKEYTYHPIEKHVMDNSIKQGCDNDEYFQFKKYKNVPTTLNLRLLTNFYLNSRTTKHTQVAWNQMKLIHSVLVGNAKIRFVINIYTH